MHRRDSTTRNQRWSSLGVLFVALALVASACSGAGPDVVAAPTPERDETPLLPATPRPTSPSAVSQDAEGAPTAIAADASPTPLAASEPLVIPVNCLGPRTRVAQLLLPLANQPELAGAVAMATAGELGGIALLGQPDAQLADAIAELQRSSFVPLLVASDEEGGAVQRLASLLGPMPSAATTATTMTPTETYTSWLEYGNRVKALGIDVVLGPVVDVGGAPGIENRSFGDDPDLVSSYAGAVAQGLVDAGIVPVFKHFPGHGRASGDSHIGLPTTPDLASLRTIDLVPYATLFSRPELTTAGVMVGHLSVPGLTGDLPTSLSPDTITGLLRTEFGFQGLVFSDAVNMGAIVNSFGASEAVEGAIRAGSDIIILGSLAELSPAIDHLVAVAEADPAFAAVVDDRVRRVLVAKGQGELCLGAR